MRKVALSDHGTQINLRIRRAPAGGDVWRSWFVDSGATPLAERACAALGAARAGPAERSARARERGRDLKRGAARGAHGSGAGGRL
jgi:hypothetical protein